MISFRPAVRENEPIRLGLAGPSRSGKSESALRVARGLVGGDNKKIVAINTERGGIAIYADKFPGFIIGTLTAPFSPERYEQAIKAALDLKPGCVIIDSASHEHEGAGGVLAMHEEELDRRAGDDWKKREALTWSAWIKPKAQHGSYVQTFLQADCHLIFCFRAKEKLKLVRNQQGKTEPVPQGYQPIISDGMEYEMHSLITLGENSKGIPDLKAQATGLREPVDRFLKESEGRSLDEEFGKKLAAWARGGAGGSQNAAAPAAQAAELSIWIWVGADGRTADRKTEDEWVNRTVDAMGKAAEQPVLDAAIQRNGGVFQAIIAAGHKEAVDKVMGAYRDRIKQLVEAQ